MAQNKPTNDVLDALIEKDPQSRKSMSQLDKDACERDYFQLKTGS